MEHVVDDASDSGKSLESELEEDESEYDDMSDGAQMYSTTGESSSDDDDNAVDSDDGEVCVSESQTTHPCPLLVELFLLFIIYYLLFIIYYLLFIIYYLLFIIYYLLFIIYYLLFIIYYPNRPLASRLQQAMSQQLCNSATLQPINTSSSPHQTQSTINLHLSLSMPSITCTMPHYHYLFPVPWRANALPVIVPFFCAIGVHKAPPGLHSSFLHSLLLMKPHTKGEIY